MSNPTTPITPNLSVARTFLRGIGAAALFVKDAIHIYGTDREDLGTHIAAVLNELDRLTQVNAELKKDSDRLSFFDTLARPLAVHGGEDDGHTGKVWAISAAEGDLRTVLDVLREIPGVAEKNQDLA